VTSRCTVGPIVLLIFLVLILDLLENDYENEERVR
jgi:hypothetical protein